MKGQFWNSSDSRRTGTKHPGKAIVQDYHGLHNESNQVPKEAEVVSGSDALTRMDETEQRRLNEGRLFSGTLVRRQVGHARIYVAHHQDLGPCAYVDQPTSYANNEIEICHDGCRSHSKMSRGSFFERLSADPVSEEEVASTCAAYERVHIRCEKP